MRKYIYKVIFQGAIVDKGAQVIKYNNIPYSIYSIIKMLINKQATPFQIQQELIQNSRQITKTSAGRQLNADLGEISARFQRETKDPKRVRDKSAAKIQELRELLEQTQREKEELSRSRVSAPCPPSFRLGDLFYALYPRFGITETV